MLRSRYCYTSQFIEDDVRKMSQKIAAILLPADGSIPRELLSLHFLSCAQNKIVLKCFHKSVAHQNYLSLVTAP
jgi:hypothetical protein